MRSAVIIGHGRFASGLLSAVEMIRGKQENIYALDWTDDMSPYVLKQRFQHLIEKLIAKSKVIFIFVDMEQATPYRVALDYIQSSTWTSKIFLLPKVQLPMLLEYTYLPNTLSNEAMFKALQKNH